MIPVSFSFFIFHFYVVILCYFIYFVIIIFGKNSFLFILFIIIYYYNYLLINCFFIKKIIIFSCSGMFHVLGFIDALIENSSLKRPSSKRILKDLIIQNLQETMLFSKIA